jgi:hypothetical protein
MKIAIGILIIITSAISLASDGTIWFGNADGSPLVMRVDKVEKIPVWIQTNPDVYVAAVHIPLATDDRFISERLGMDMYAPFKNEDVPDGYDKGWDVVDIMDTEPMFGRQGYTDQDLLAFMDLMKNRNLPLHCEKKCMVMEFVVKTAPDDSLRGHSYDVLIEGFQERNRGLHFSDTLGVRTFDFETVFSPIYFLCPGDINDDSQLDERDIEALKSYLDQEFELPWPEQRADFNDDGIIDEKDLTDLTQKVKGR